jgi:hypothetical protein
MLSVPKAPRDKKSCEKKSPNESRFDREFSASPLSNVPVAKAELLLPTALPVNSVKFDTGIGVKARAYEALADDKNNMLVAPAIAKLRFLVKIIVLSPEKLDVNVLKSFLAGTSTEKKFLLCL